MDEENKVITCSAPVNIAVIKYWGKLDDKLIIPLNDSISFTLGQDEMYAKTTVMASKHFTKDRFWLNGKEERTDNPRFSNCLNEVKRRAAKRKLEGDNPVLQWHVHICSTNNFPTAAGLASSAAGYAALVFSLSQLYSLDGDLSSIARLGSGSACRSMYGGLVRWFRGSSTDGSDSRAKQISIPDSWRSLHAIICIANDGRKKVPSTEGMLRCLETSNLLKHRIEKSLPQRIEALLKAVSEEDWSTFCDLVMKDSNEMHAVCQDSLPPCVYMNDTSHAVSHLVHEYNRRKERMEKEDEKVCYTFDAGPNACLFVPEASLREFSSLLGKCFPRDTSTNQPLQDYWQGIPISMPACPQELASQLSESCRVDNHSFKYFIHTRLGEGPRVLDDPQGHLLDTSTGLPREIAAPTGVPRPAAQDFPPVP